MPARSTTKPIPERIDPPHKATAPINTAPDKHLHIESTSTTTPQMHAPSHTSQDAEQAPTFGYFEQFGLHEALISRVLREAMSRGADHADFFFEYRTSQRLALEDNEVNRASSGIDLGVGIRAVKGLQTGYAYSEDLSEAALVNAARLAASIANAASAFAMPQLTGHALTPKLYHSPAPGAGAAITPYIPLLTQLNKTAHGLDPRVQKVNASLSQEFAAILIARSDGFMTFDFQPMSVVGLSCVAESAGVKEQNSYNIAMRAGMSHFDEARLQRIAQQAVARTLILFEATSIPAGEMPVVLGAGSSGILLHEAIGHGLEADFNRKGVSIYADKLGKAIAKPFVTIVDDGTMPEARGSIHVDDEGCPSQNTVLVENGVLSSYLHDAMSARFYGLKPTGSGRRESFRSPPLPRMRSTYMQNGPHRREEIIQSVKRGIYCESFSNGQVQIGAGDFTFYVKNGFLIEDGRLTKPIKDVNLIGNGPKALELVDMVANDLVIDEGGWTCGKDGQSVPVSQGMPTVRVSKMTVGGTA